jgi:excisionase family DNA binding protein
MKTGLNTIEKLMTIDDLMEILNVSKPTIYRYIYKRQIGYIRVGNNIRFRKKDILEYIENNCVEPIIKCKLYGC